LGSSEKVLAGKRIVVTRAPEQARELVRTLEERGAQVVSLPMISFAPPESSERLDEQLRQLDSFDAVVFLSQNAVRYTFDRCAQLGIQCETRLSGRGFIGAVGPATARALKERGVRVDYVAEKGTGEALARELGPSLAGRRVLLPRSDQGDERVPSALRALGAKVTEVIAYRTTGPAALSPEILAETQRAGVDAIVFASPSAVHSLARVVGETDLPTLSERVPFVAIGPTTANAIRSAGAQVRIEASESSASGIVDALVQHFTYKAAPARRA
jgi:uroporphyrinogen-III synthase